MDQVLITALEVVIVLVVAVFLGLVGWLAARTLIDAFSDHYDPEGIEEFEAWRSALRRPHYVYDRPPLAHPKETKSCHEDDPSPRSKPKTSSRSNSTTWRP